MFNLFFVLFEESEEKKDFSFFDKHDEMKDKRCYSIRMSRQMLKEGISIRLIESEDMDELYRVFQLNKDYLRLHINGIDQLQSREDVYRRWGRFNDHSLPLGIWLNNTELIGRCRLTRYIQSNSADIGYWLSECHQGQGVMTAAVAFCMKFAFDEWNIQRIEIQCSESNLKSRGIAERLGFINEGISLDDPLIEVNGEMVQSLIYSKSK